MKRAIVLARKAEGFTSPNPMVGAVLVKNNKIIAEGYHEKAGLPHAEAIAIMKAGDKAGGSTLYVNLEPCCHRDKRTPPCTDAIISSGIKKVVVSMRDPNPKVSGKGILKLKRNGIETEVGILENESAKLNRFYTKYMKTGRPYVILKTAMTLDGKIATPEGESKWITSERSRRYVHKLRGHVDAVLSAIGTVKADNPLFTSRIKGTNDPTRVIIDPELVVPEGYNILNCPPRTVMVTKKRNRRARELSNRGIVIINYSGRLDLNELMEKLGAMEITSLLIEGGASLASHAFEDGVVDRIMYFIAPKIIGGRKSYPAVGGDKHRRIEDAIKVKDISIRRFGEDILIEGELR